MDPCDNIYIKDLPGGLTDDDVIGLASAYGTVVSVKVLNCREGEDWSAALVRYETVDEAALAVSSMHGEIPEGGTKPLNVQFKVDTKGKGGKGKSKGGKGGKSAFGGKDSSKGGKARGYSPYHAQPQFQAPQMMIQPLSQPFQAPAHHSPPAHQQFQMGGKGGTGGKGKSSYSMEDLVKLISDSGALPGGDGTDPATYTEVYVNGLPTDCSNEHLFRIMSPFGQISARGLTVMRNKATGHCMGYAFVNYLAPESADLAIQTLHGTTLPDGKLLNVSVKKAGTGKGKGKGKSAGGGRGGSPSPRVVPATHGVGLQAEAAEWDGTEDDGGWGEAA